MKNKVFVLLIAPFLIVFLISAILGIRIFWVGESLIGIHKTYPTATLMGERVGGLTPQEAFGKVRELKKGLDTESFRLDHQDKRWEFTLGELGITLDEERTSANLSGSDPDSLSARWNLAKEQKRQALIIALALLVDTAKCSEAVSVVSIVKKTAQRAVVYFDSKLGVKEDIKGSEFDSALACTFIAEKITRGELKGILPLKILNADITQADVHKIRAELNNILSGDLILTYKQNKWIYSPADLFNMFELIPGEEKPEIRWDEAKLDVDILKIKKRTDFDNKMPKTAVCNYVAEINGYRLDAANTKDIFKNLVNNLVRQYELKVDYEKPEIKKREPLKAGKKIAYLTFDDAATYGHKILDLAGCYGIKVTFFIIGSRVGADASVMTRAIANGSAVQSHGYIHAAGDYASGHSYEWQKNDIAASISAITSITGRRPTLFRPPGANLNNDTYKAAAANGITLITWSISSEDTAPISQSKICKNVVRRTYDGANILMHAHKEKTYNALPCIIEGLGKRGFSLKALW